MYLSDLNECLMELPEISVLELFRFRSAVGGSFRWTGKEAIKRGSTEPVGPICVDDRGVEYVIWPALNKKAPDEPVEVCRVTRPNNTLQFHKMIRSGDIPANIREALVDFVSSSSWKMAV